jgi:hypothetical protein
MIAGENECDYIRSAFEKEAAIDTGSAFKEVFPKSTNIHASVEMRAAKGPGCRPHRSRNGFQLIIGTST